MTTDIRVAGNRARAILFAAVFLLVAPIATHAAAPSLELYPTTGTLKVGSAITLGVFLSSHSNPINAVSAVMSFPSDVLEVSSIDVSNSILNVWVEQPSFSNDTGTIRFGGVTFNPGFNGQHGRLVSIHFKVKSVGKANIRFVSDMVLSNDGKGTELPVNDSSVAVFTALSDMNQGVTENVLMTDVSSAKTDLAMNRYGPFPNSSEWLILFIVLSVLTVTIYNGYRLRRLEEIGTKNGLTADKREMLKKIKKDLDDAENLLTDKDGRSSS